MTDPPDGDGTRDDGAAGGDGAHDPDGAASAAMTGRLDYPMFVVTAASGGEAGGCLAGFVSQCSIVPCRFVACISKENHTLRIALDAGALGLHLLGEDQMDLASVFGELTADRAGKLDLVDWHAGETGAPVLDQCAAWVEGPVVARVDFGDHVGHVVEPVAGGAGRRTGELWYSAARHLRPGHPPDESRGRRS